MGGIEWGREGGKGKEGGRLGFHSAVFDPYGVVSLSSQVLQKKFDDFKRDVGVSTERYTAANNLARRLVAEGHSDTVLIKEKQDTMR